MKNHIKNIKIRKWKYKVIVEDIRNAELFNELGEKGWELCIILKEPLNVQSKIYWKRKVSIYKKLIQLKEDLQFIILSR